MAHSAAEYCRGISRGDIQYCNRAIADRVCPTYDDAIRGVKDIAAGAVVIMAVYAAISGIIIFIPKFL